ncbi:DUF924 family protein [Zobellella maritima]|uniref:DUF924 family protein n=1 Tax=Zobellella maritima TaxID=2059725 RepID=UPI000E30072C|nr:DUF924 family protein [Zobellella maritima]
MTPATVIRFWFGEQPSGISERVYQKRWFAGGPAFDREIVSRFGGLLEQALAGELDGWAEHPQGRLALVLLLDQFTRNAYRRDPRAFAGDTRATSLVLDALAKGEDKALTLSERLFFYLPLEHAEDLACQCLSVACFESLAGAFPAAHRSMGQQALDYARRHLDIIYRFGRFPHRNAILGRADTEQESRWLAEGGERFGQG